jgi:molybdopterin-guanine dinucleotide biosynthesis protein A
MKGLYKDITGVILAGGKSSRFGKNKAFALYQGMPFIQRILQVMQSVFADVVLVTNTPESYQSLPVKILVDQVPYQGPLGGIVTALESSPHPKIFVVACDMPLLNKKVIRDIIERGGRREAAIPVYQGQPEYLLALYSQDLRKAMVTALSNGVRSLYEFCKPFSHEIYLPLTEGASFNVNTPQDLEALA